MNSAEYQRLSLRTVPAPLAFWATDSDEAHEAARRDFLCNCALGMAGESAEIAHTPTADEIGDGYWYAFVLFHALGVENYEPQPDPSLTVDTAHRAAGAVCELVKKHAFHGRTFDAVRNPLIEQTRRYVDALASLDAQTPAQTFAQNVGKLRARYPAGFFERG